MSQPERPPTPAEASCRSAEQRPPVAPATSETARKAALYLAVTAMFVLWAENANLPGQVWIPPLYPSYGIPVVWFLTTLAATGTTRAAPWFLFGTLVGLITETYVAKVTFFGLQPNCPQVAGLAVGPILFIVLFYHPWFSFLVPAHAVSILWGFPCRTPLGAWGTRLLFAVPVLLMPFTLLVQLTRQYSPGFLIGRMTASMVLLLLIGALLRRLRLADVRLDARERKGFALISALCYLFLFFVATNHEHGRSWREISLPAMGLVTIVIILFWALGESAARASGERSPGPVPFDGSRVDWQLFVIWAGWYYLVAVGGALVGTTLTAPPEKLAKGIAVLGVLATLVSVPLACAGACRMISRPKR